MSERDIFIVALQQEDPARRQAYLEGACAHHPELRRQVEELLRLYEGAGSFLESPAAASAVTEGFPEATEPAVPHEAPGTAVGQYKLLEQVGEGGMGTVWMAQQNQPVRRLVAVKFIKAGMDSRQVITRFEAERQALALMDHPNIARVLDGGATAAGRPYFVMDLVKGVPITQYCDEHRLTPRQRLELFIPVCQAVQHAHQKGIIHRDLKPSNVLVAPYDGRPVPKVIDFGVAKATGQQLTDKTLVTGFGSVVGTLEYMSPEQAEVNQLDVDTRSDIYSLGVLLYELLVGSPPFSRKELGNAGMLEMLRVIREREPSKPSTKLSTAEGLPTLAANRGTEPAKLTNLMRGELDWIVMKALEKDRNRRYETANDFARDVQRYLADEPVLAGPPTASYRLRKFFKRNKGPVIAGSVILLSLVGGIIGTSAGLVWAVRERDHKAAALDAETRAHEAKKQARDKAMATLRAMTDDIVENQMARDTQLTEENKEFLRKILTHFEGFAAITADDAESRAIRAEGYARVGLMRHRLGEPKEAEAAYAEAIALWKQLAADVPTDPELPRHLAISQNNLGILLRTTGRVQEAEAAYGEALALRKQLAADFPTHPELRRDLAASRDNRGNLLRDMGRLRVAEEDYREALDIRKRLADEFPEWPDFRRNLAASHNNLGTLFRETGRLKEAEAAYREALDIRKRLAADFPARRPDYRQHLGASHLNLGLLLHETGRVKEAEAAFAEALAVQKRLAADFPLRAELRQELAVSHSSRGSLLVPTGRGKDAEAAFAEALEIQKRLAADFPDRPDFRRDLAVTHGGRGNLYSSTGRPREAEAAHGEALALRKQLVADFPDRPDFRQELAQSHSSLGSLFHETGRLKEAEAAFAEALAVQKHLTDDFPDRADFRRYLGAIHNHRGGLYSSTGRPKEAEAAYAEAVAVHKRLADDSPDRPDFRWELSRCHHNLGNLLRETGRLKEAEAAYAEALALQKRLADDSPDHPDFRRALSLSHENLGILLTRTGRVKEAEAAFAEALALRKRLADDFPDRLDFRKDLGAIHNNQALLLARTSRPKEAEAAFAEAVAVQKQLAADFPDRPDFRDDLALTHRNRGNLFRDTRRPKEAEVDHAESLALRKQLVADFPDRPDFRQGLAQSHGNLGNLFGDTSRPKEAEAAHAEALALRKRLADEFPDRADFRRELSISHNSLGLLYSATGRPKEAEAAYAEALAVRKRLVADFPNQPDLSNDLAGVCVNLAFLRLRQRDYQAAKAHLEEAGPHHLAALKANPGNPTYRQFYRNNLRVLIQANAGLGDPAGATQAAEKMRDVGWDPPGNAYDAARALASCTAIVLNDDKATKEERDKQAQFYGDEAMKMLHDAVARGANNAAFIKQDAELGPLRTRDDFKKLIAELEGKRNP